ncbi:MAG: ATP-binding protein [Roseiarcus sp.]|jgi:two-component system phosphate regulon sensor histidine kinase PhoR
MTQKATQILDSQIRSHFCAGLVAAMPEPALVIGPDGRIAAANEPAEALLPAMRLGEPLVLALRAPDVLDCLRRVMATGRAETVLWSERVPVERLFDVCVAPLSAETGETGAALITLRDLTEARRVERMRVDFIANASHELRTPLASLLGFVDTLQGPARDDPRAREKFLGIMREQGRRMARLVDDLLSLSRIEQNQHVRPETPIDLALIARHVADTLAPLASEMGVDLEVEASQPVIVAGDRDELLRVAENLIENAIKYGAPADPSRAERVEIAVTRTAREGWLTVRDHGRGIAPEHLPRLTERFYRVDAGQSRSKGGTGLGLAIVKHIMARHRGRLTIASRVGQGSTFAAMAPLHPSQIE